MAVMSENIPELLGTNFEEIAEAPTRGNQAGFANSLAVWINKPHVVNRRLCGTRINNSEVITGNQLSLEYVTKLVQTAGFTLDNSADISSSGCSVEDKHDSCQNEIENIAELDEQNVLVIVRELLTKQPDKYRNYAELIVYDKSQQMCNFYPLRPLHDDVDASSEQVEVSYRFTLSNNSSIKLQCSSSSFDEDSERKMSITWLKSQLLKKIARWSGEPKLNTSITSLKLLNLEEYSLRYTSLKAKYGLHFAKIWPERTDPQKFVYEDVAIATYLLLLWKQDREVKGLTEKQSFVDLGCGNGLLVHILASEGHPGYGIDVRKRRIWDLYGPETVLKEMPITPSRDSLFPDCDWLIGNHSDELTPWIPVMAARSSYTCCYLVLPCCHYDFDSRYGYDTKFHRGSGDDTSQYRNYLNFICKVGETCGFKVEEDMLRIPSTKRVCFIGRNRLYPNTPEAESDIDKQRTEFIDSRCKQNNLQPDNSSSDANISNTQHPGTLDDKTLSESLNGSASWAADFTPRNNIETVRNCITVRPEIKKTVVTTVFDRLLSSDTQIVDVDNGKTWRKGGRLSVSDAAGLFDKALLQELKCECGGLQTLLRNSSHIFQVTSGMVQLRDFTLDDPWSGLARGKRARKTKQRDTGEYLKTGLCYFHDHHPDGCPRTAENCDYAHGVDELREKPKKIKK